MPRAKIIAEISGNHAGSLGNALALVRAAQQAGADLVKFQAFTLDEMTPPILHAAYILPDGPWAGQTLRSLYARTRTPLDWLPELFGLARELGLEPLASVFGETSLAAVAALRPSLYKIASAEALDTAFVQKVKHHGQVLMSLGCRDYMTPGTIPMWCVAEYPAASAHLPNWKISPWGFSDHTTGHLAAQLAVGRGVTYLEKHLMLEDVPCEDEAFSLTPQEFRRYVDAVRAAEAHLTPRTEMPSTFVRRWVAAKDLRAGMLLPGDLQTARANVGILAHFPLKRLRVAKRYGEPIYVGEAE